MRSFKVLVYQAALAWGVELRCSYNNKHYTSQQVEMWPAYGGWIGTKSQNQKKERN